MAANPAAPRVNSPRGSALAMARSHEAPPRSPSKVAQIRRAARASTDSAARAISRALFRTTSCNGCGTVLPRGSGALWKIRCSSSAVLVAANGLFPASIHGGPSQTRRYRSGRRQSRRSPVLATCTPTVPITVPQRVAASSTIRGLGHVESFGHLRKSEVGQLRVSAAGNQNVLQV